MHRPPNIQRRVGTKQNPSWIHQKQVGIPESSRLNTSEDVRRISSCDTPKNVRGRVARVVEEIGNVVVWHAKFAETVKQIWAIARSRSTCNVVLNLAANISWTADLRIQPR